MTALLLLLLAASPSPAETVRQPLPGDPLRATVHELPNGLTVYLSENHQEPRVTAWIAVRAGSKHDPADSTGMAHYLEHMLFKGTARLGTLDYEKEKPHLERIAALYETLFGASDPEERRRIFKEIDAENAAASAYAAPNELAKAYQRLGFTGVNAFTADEQTVYVCSFPKNRAEAWAKLEAERFARPVFRLFQGELETVYEEKNRALDNAERALEEALAKALYKVHPYGQQPTLGTIEHLKNPSLAKMYAYFQAHYVPSNMAVALAGDFDSAEMLALLERHLGAWKPARAPEPRAWALPPPRGAERLELTYEGEEKVSLSWPAVPKAHPDADALAVADLILDSAAGLLSLDLVQAQKVRAAGTMFDLKNDAGDWTLWAVAKKDQPLEEVERLLLAEAAKLRDGDFSEADVRAAVINDEVAEKERLESDDGRAAAMAAAFIAFEPWERAVGRRERLRRVTKKDVVAAAVKYLGPDRIVAYRRNGPSRPPRIAKPEFGKLAFDEDRHSAFYEEVVAAPAAPIEPRWLVAGRDYTATDLPEGRLFAAPNPLDDLFALEFRFDFGRLQQRKLCAALDLLQLSGAGPLGAEEFKKRLHALGTRLTTTCAEQRATVSLAGLDENLPASLDLLRRRFEAPNVSSGTLARMIEVALGARRDAKRDPAVVSRALGAFARRGAESEFLTDLGDAELRGLALDELTALIRGLFDFKRRIAYVGNRPPRELARLAADGRAAWKDPPPARPVRYVRPKAPRALLAHREMVQAQVGVFAGDEVYDPRRAVDYQFLSQYLGGGMSAVVFQEIREARALAYAAWGGYLPAQRRGDENLLTGALGCQADKTPEAAELLARLLREPPLSAARFAETAKGIEEGYRTNPLTFRQANAALMLWEDLGLKGDPRPARFRRVLAYRLADLAAFSKRFRGRPMTAAILADRARLDLEALKKLGALEEKKLDEIFAY